MEFPNQQSNKVNLYQELLKDERMIHSCIPMVKAKFREAVIDKGRCCWETLSIHELLKMLQDHQHKFFIRGMNNRRDAADLVGISMMILSKCEEGEFKYLDGIPLPQMPQPMPCPYGSDNASEKFDEECDAILRQIGSKKIVSNTYQSNSKNRITTPYGSLIFNVIHSERGYEVAIQLFNNGLDAGEYGYGFYTKKDEAINEMQSDIRKLIDDQIDADTLLGITNNPRYIKSIPNQGFISFAPRHYQKILDHTKIRTARKQDKSGDFTIKGKRFRAEFEIAMTIPAFKSLFDSGFYTPEQFGFESSRDMWEFYHNYFEDLVYIHKISEVQDAKPTNS